MNEIPRSMIQLAHESGADIEAREPNNSSQWYTNPVAKSGNLNAGFTYRISNKTADGLRLDELLKKAYWCLDYIAYEGCLIEKVSSHLKDTEELIYWICRNPEALSNYSLFKYPEPKTRPMTAYEIAMLPQGTAFVELSGNKIYSPTITECNRHGIYINREFIEEFNGYILPNETELRKFEVEE